MSAGCSTRMRRGATVERACPVEPASLESDATTAPICGTKNYSLRHLPGATVLSPFYDLNSSLPFELPATVRARDYRAFDGVRLAFSIDGADTIGSLGPDSVRVLEHDAQLRDGYLAEFALRRSKSRRRRRRHRIPAGTAPADRGRTALP
jgi:hypothetical protein